MHASKGRILACCCRRVAAIELRLANGQITAGEWRSELTELELDVAFEAAITTDDMAARAGFRRHQRQPRSIAPTGRAITGAPLSHRRNSSARSRAVA